MIKHICVCDICETEEFFDPENQARPNGWHSIYELINNGEYFTYICPSCWKELQVFAKQLHERKCCH